VEINPVLKREFTRYIRQHDLDPDDYLFTSRQGVNTPIGRSMAYKVLRDIGETFNLDAIGTHTMRKTFGYHFYKQTGDVVTLMQIFNHSSQSMTMRYIGMTQESINNSMKKFKYF
jgi:integrase